jgi:SAM-dependent MidA family methyltransferase
MPADASRLPEPSPEERALSERLGQAIRAEIECAGGAIDFSRFMELALYAPGLGYYSAGARKFGEGGDFVTAPELGSVFARCLARQCREILEHLGGDVQGCTSAAGDRTSGAADILEAGAGSGRLAADLLLELERLGRLPDRYFILELSADLRSRQQATLQERAPRLAARVQWLDRLPERFRGVVIGNELLDALPVERFRVTAGGVRQLQVGMDGDTFAWRERDADTAIRRRVEPLNLPLGYESEIGLAAEAWVRTVAETIDAGVLLLIDYGFPRAEFYHPQRATGTLMCHYRHRAHPDPLVLVGLQDITAHVDFSAIAAAAVLPSPSGKGNEGEGRAGLVLLGYTSQAMFLLGCGLDSIASASDPNDTRAHLALTTEIKKLTLPTEMGELFKVIALGRGVAAPLAGFRLQDRRRAISGSG